MNFARASCFALALCVGCSSGVSLRALLVEPGTATLRAGATLQLSATQVKSDGSTQDVSSTATWTSSDATKAKVSASGLVTAIAAGSATITATQGKLTATATLSVTAAGLKAIAVVASRKAVPRGFSELLSAQGVFDDGTTQDLTATATWTSSNFALATVAAGKLTAIAAGAVTVTAASGGVSGSVDLTVSSAVLGSIAVSPAAPTVPAGLSLPLRATGGFDDGSTLDLTTAVAWSSSSSSVVSVGAQSGVVTARSGGGPVTITATHAASGISGTAAVTVGAATLTGITITGAVGALAPGKSFQLTATGMYSDGSTQDLTASVSWSSKNESLATVAAGLVSAAAETAGGDVEIDASGPGGHTASITIHVGIAVMHLSIAPAALALAASSSYQLAATAFYNDGTSSDVTHTSTWSSDSTAVSFADASSGLLLAARAGTAHVTASSSGVSTSIVVTVSGVPLVSVEVSPNDPVLPAGVKQQFSATGLFADGTTTDLTAQVTWSTDCGANGSISLGGLFTAGSSTEGSCGVTAKDSASGLQMTAQLSFTSAQPVAFFIEPATATVATGNTLQLTGLALMTDGTVQDQTQQGYWSMPVENSVISVDHGLVTALGAGGPEIVHFSQGCSGDGCPPQGTASITVTAAALVALRISPASATLPLGTTLQLSAIGIYSDGSQADLTGSATWSGGDSHVSVDAHGLAHALMQGGPTAIGAAHEPALTDSAELSAGPPALVQIALGPAYPAMLQGGTQALTATGTYSDGSTNPSLSGLTWSSDSTNVATVDSSTGVVTASETATGTAVIHATDPASQVTALTTAYVSLLNALRLTDKPSFSPDPVQATGMLTVTLHITNNVSDIYVYIEDEQGITFGTGHVTDNGSGGVLGQTTVAVPVQLSCFAAAKAYAKIQLNGGSAGYSYYYRFNLYEGEYFVDTQYTPAAGDSSTYVPVAISTTSITAPPDGTCVFPFMVGTPTVPTPVVGDTQPIIGLNVSSNVTGAGVTLRNMADNSNLGSGFACVGAGCEGGIAPGGGHIADSATTVPVQVTVAPTACYSPATQVFADVTLSGALGTSYSTEYLQVLPSSTANYVVQYSDLYGKSEFASTSIALGTAAWQADTGTCSSVPALTGTPTITSNNQGLPGQTGFTASVPVSAGTYRIVVYLRPYPSGDTSVAGGGGEAQNLSGAGTYTVPFSTLANAAPGTYGLEVLVSDSTAVVGSHYFFDATSSPDYSLQQTDKASYPGPTLTTTIPVMQFTVGAP